MRTWASTHRFLTLLFFIATATQSAKDTTPRLILGINNGKQYIDRSSFWFIFLTHIAVAPYLIPSEVLANSVDFYTRSWKILWMKIISNLRGLIIFTWNFKVSRRSFFLNAVASDSERRPNCDSQFIMVLGWIVGGLRASNILLNWYPTSQECVPISWEVVVWHYKHHPNEGENILVLCLMWFLLPYTKTLKQY